MLRITIYCIYDNIFINNINSWIRKKSCQISHSICLADFHFSHHHSKCYLD